MNFPKIPTHSQENEPDASMREFDDYLREIDDFLPNHLGEVPGLSVPPDFASRVTARARAEMRSTAEAKPEWSLRHWFLDFNLSARLAVAAAILLALFCGFRAGRVVTETVTRRNAPPQAEIVDPLGMAVPELAVVQMIHSDGLTTPGQPARTGGEQ